MSTTDRPTANPNGPLPAGVQNGAATSKSDPPTASAGDALAVPPVMPAGSSAPDKKRWLGIGQQLYLGLAGGVALTLLASLVAYFSFRQILYYEARLAEYSIPNLSSAIDTARQSAAVVNGALRLISASSPEQHEAVAKTVADERSALSTLINELESRSAFGERTQLIKAHLNELGGYMEEIRESSARRLVIADILERLRGELAETSRRIERHIVNAIDDQGFYLVEGLRSLNDDQPDPVAERASGTELAYYRDLTEVNHQANLAVLLLDEAFVLSDRGLLLPLRERFRSAVQNFQRAYVGLSSRISMPASLLGGDLERLAQTGESGGGGIIPLRQEGLLRLEREQEALAKARTASSLLLAEVNKLVTGISDEAVNVSNASRSAAQTGLLLLVMLNITSVTGAFLIGWLFVGRHLVRRLVGLATAMRSMAGGNLEVPVEVKGSDEVTDMAKALEVFRRHALEVQRLNLVEKLAEELNAKNQTLEQTLDNLKSAQEQIVAEKKLSSLGQLTAGVAHELKNPLNFVNNFSDVSVELVDEIEEVMEEAKEEPLELSEEISPILSDLRLNLQKVKEHGQRADGIVRSMLDHSRATPGQWREIDVNALLKQYVELAYHAMRAHNTNFNVTLTDDLDPDMGKFSVIPQDLGRVFLNLATNAYQAIEEKRHQANGGYEPELRISSRRLKEQAEFCIRDNGIGIPEAMREQIFEPFVTTKKPGEGTGLGLSLTADILTRHGGSIHLDTEEGTFTELRITLPLEPPPEAAEAALEEEREEAN